MGYFKEQEILAEEAAEKNRKQRVEEDRLFELYGGPLNYENSYLLKKLNAATAEALRLNAATFENPVRVDSAARRTQENLLMVEADLVETNSNAATSGGDGDGPEMMDVEAAYAKAICGGEYQTPVERARERWFSAQDGTPEEEEPRAAFSAALTANAATSENA